MSAATMSPLGTLTWAAWLAALRSGEWLQGTGLLCSIDDDTNDVRRFCCLGVLCDIVDGEAWEEWGATGFRWRLGVDGVDSERYYSPVDIFPADRARLEWVLRSMVGITETHDPSRWVERGLAQLNDDGLTFAQIADLIEWAGPAKAAA